MVHTCRFLYEPNSAGYKYYRRKLEEFRKANDYAEGLPPVLDTNLKRKAEGGAPSCLVVTPPPPAPLAKQVAAAASKKKRKSRWGPEEEKVDLPPPELAQQTEDQSPTPLSG